MARNLLVPAPFVLAILSLLAAVKVCLAHKLHVDVRRRGDQIRIEAFFDDDTPAQQARIVVLRGEHSLLEGRTDETGVWSCPAPPPGTYVVRAESLGHAAQATIQIEEERSTEQLDAVPADAQRGQRTTASWQRVAIGLAIIACATLLAYRLRRWSRQHCPRC